MWIRYLVLSFYTTCATRYTCRRVNNMHPLSFTNNTHAPSILQKLHLLPFFPVTRRNVKEIQHNS